MTEEQVKQRRAARRAADQAVRHRRAGRRARALPVLATPPRRSPAPTSRSTAAGPRSEAAPRCSIRGRCCAARAVRARVRGRRQEEDQSRAAGRRRAWRLHLGRARPPPRRRAARDRGHLGRLGRRHQRRHAGRRARARRPRRGARSGSPISGAPRASAATCRRCSAPWSSGCSRSCRSKARRCRPGSTRCRAICRPTTSTRSTSIRSRTLIERFVDFEAVRALASSRCSSRRPMCTPAACASSRATRSPPTWSWRRPACRSCSARSRSTACPIGTAAISAIRRSSRSSTRPRREDVLIVQINPLERKEVPTSRKDIMNRINEITFNSSLIVGIPRDRLRRPADRPGPARRAAPGPDSTGASTCTASCSTAWASTSTATPSSRTDYDFFEMLRHDGKRAARRFLDAHFDDIGVRSTFDLRAEAQAEWA